MPEPPYIVDNFNRSATGTGAGLAEGGSDVNQTWARTEGADVDVNINGSALVQVLDFGGFQIWTGNTANAGPVELETSVSSFGVGDANQQFTVYLRRDSSANNAYSFRWDGATVGLQINRNVSTGGGPASITLGQSPRARLTSFKMRFQCMTMPEGPVLLRAKMWSGDEPREWDLVTLDGTAQRLLSGAYGSRFSNQQGTSDLAIDYYVIRPWILEPILVLNPTQPRIDRMLLSPASLLVARGY